MERFQDKLASQREVSELVGPYVLLAEIGRGELTTVYLAKKHGALGFQRLYALKRLKPALARNADCVELLLDEARLVSGLHHANVAGVLDIGNDAGGSYVVMEYIEGENLEGLLSRAGAARHPRYTVPPFVDALSGLHELHSASDADGAPYSIVHQAPRARHIVLGVDGTARLVDFSQVRGKNVRPTRSRSDRIKVAYMAPEQALHPDGVDFRADLFIAGIALWEALTGERLFAADTDEQTFQNMLHRRIPRPSDVGLRPPRCFDAICMRALERDPKNRYPSALEMARDLRDTAINQALYATPSELGQWVRHLAGSELRTLRKLAGQDMASSGGISLETPSAGLDLSGLRRPEQLSDGLVALPNKAEGADNPYVTGRIYGGSEARVPLLLSAEQERTPALGFRREKPLMREDEDDDATGPRPLPGAAARKAVYDERARAATVALTAAGGALGALPTQEEIATASKAQSTDNDETNPSVFVPARVGARREGSGVSPGAYSQIDSTRRQSIEARTAREQIEARTSREQDEAHAARAQSELRDSSPGRAASKAAGSAATSPEIVSAKALLEKTARGFDEADTTLRPSQLPRSADGNAERTKQRTATQSYEAARFRIDKDKDGRAIAVTEHPPAYVQRRDSSPTRMEIPVGPVGSPHRPFTPERMPAASARPALRASSHPFDVALEAGASEGFNAGVLPDSLTPPATASRTAPPHEVPPPRASALWLVSGVLAAIILLAMGVGFKQWMAGAPAERPSVSHAASGGTREATSAPAEEPTLRAEPRPAAQPSPAPAASAPTPPASDAAEGGADTSPIRAEPARPAPKARAATVKRLAPKAGVAQPAGQAAPKAAGSHLPDNPY